MNIHEHHIDGNGPLKRLQREEKPSRKPLKMTLKRVQFLKERFADITRQYSQLLLSSPVQIELIETFQVKTFETKFSDVKCSQVDTFQMVPSLKNGLAHDMQVMACIRHITNISARFREQKPQPEDIKQCIKVLAKHSYAHPFLNDAERVVELSRLFALAYWNVNALYDIQSYALVKKGIKKSQTFLQEAVDIVTKAKKRTLAKEAQGMLSLLSAIDKHLTHKYVQESFSYMHEIASSKMRITPFAHTINVLTDEIGHFNLSNKEQRNAWSSLYVHLNSSLNFRELAALKKPSLQTICSYGELVFIRLLREADTFFFEIFQKYHQQTDFQPQADPLVEKMVNRFHQLVQEIPGPSKLQFVTDPYWKKSIFQKS